MNKGMSLEATAAHPPPNQSDGGGGGGEVLYQVGFLVSRSYTNMMDTLLFKLLNFLNHVLYKKMLIKATRNIIFIGSICSMKICLAAVKMT